MKVSFLEGERLVLYRLIRLDYGEDTSVYEEFVSYHPSIDFRQKGESIIRHRNNYNLNGEV